MDSILYASAPMTIGKHEWRLIIHQSRVRPGHNATTYQWREIGQRLTWNDQRSWPTYDFNNGQTAGLPVTLRDLYWREHAMVRAYCDEHNRSRR